MSEKYETNSAGQSFATSKHLDAHFIACQAEYEAMLRAADLQPGWTVLDAGFNRDATERPNKS